MTFDGTVSQQRPWGVLRRGDDGGGVHPQVGHAPEVHRPGTVLSGIENIY